MSYALQSFLSFLNASTQLNIMNVDLIKIDLRSHISLIRSQ